MAGIKASDLQYILNTIPIGGYEKAFGLDQTLIGLLGGFTPGPGRLQTPIHYSGNTQAASFAESDDISTAGVQSRRLLSHSYRRVKVTPGLDGLQEAIAKAGGITTSSSAGQTPAYHLEISSLTNMYVAGIPNGLAAIPLSGGGGTSGPGVVVVLSGDDDTVTQIIDTGTGFSFNDHTGYALFESVERAVNCFSVKSAWEKIQANGMKKDYSWKHSAEQYIELYKLAKDKRV